MSDDAVDINIEFSSNSSLSPPKDINNLLGKKRKKMKSLKIKQDPIKENIQLDEVRKKFDNFFKEENK